MAASSPPCFQCGGCQRYFDSLLDVTEHQKQCDARAPTAMVAAATEAPPAPVAAGTAPPAPMAAGTAPVAEGTGPGPATMGGKGFFWPINAVLLLIATVGDFKQEFAKGTRRKVEVWRDVALTMRQEGYPVNGEHCDKKMRSLKQRYKIIKDNSKLSGRGTDEQWPFYDVMDSFMAGDPSVQPFHWSLLFKYRQQNQPLPHTIQHFQPPLPSPTNCLLLTSCQWCLSKTPFIISSYWKHDGHTTGSSLPCFTDTFSCFTINFSCFTAILSCFTAYLSCFTANFFLPSNPFNLSITSPYHSITFPFFNTLYGATSFIH
ncbi:uncharacterized protein LOC123500452 [Portunus trituberculatus]|uniref:uncharacterized protein LOC123500452 n=1 Tax=Portunus trituberculatus TaxID=210409 RepID=UPI001E1CE533|nr:uncharacterized protein LOC123500452 [Portunus trituberculatus]